MEIEPPWIQRPRAANLAPEEVTLSHAQARLAEAIETTRRAGQAYFASPLHKSVPAREAYYDALMRQAAAEREFYDAKNGVARSGAVAKRRE